MRILFGLVLEGEGAFKCESVCLTGEEPREEPGEEMGEEPREEIAF